MANWRLSLRSPDDLTPLGTFTLAEPGPLLHGVHAVVAPGDVRNESYFYANPFSVQLTGTEVVRLELDDGEGWRRVATGVLTTSYASVPTIDAKEYRASSDLLMKRTLLANRGFRGTIPLREFLQEVIQESAYVHPALTFDPAQIEPSLELTDPYYPTDLLTFIEKVRSEFGEAIFAGVDGSGTLFVRRDERINVLTEPFSRELEYDTTDVCTGVRFVVATEANRPLDYNPYNLRTGAILFQADLASDVPATKTALLPAGVNSRRTERLGGGMAARGFAGSLNARDYDTDAHADTRPDETYARISGGNVDANLCIGIQVRLRVLAPEDIESIRLVAGHQMGGQNGGSATGAFLEYGCFVGVYESERIREEELIVPNPTGNELNGVLYNEPSFRNFSLEIRLKQGAMEGAVRVYGVRYLMLDEERLRNAARGVLFDPSLLPTEYELSEYLEPRPYLSVGGFVAPANSYRVGFIDRSDTIETLVTTRDFVLGDIDTRLLGLSALLSEKDRRKALLGALS